MQNSYTHVAPRVLGVVHVGRPQCVRVCWRHGVRATHAVFRRRLSGDHNGTCALCVLAGRGVNQSYSVPAAALR